MKKYLLILLAILPIVSYGANNDVAAETPAYTTPGNLIFFQFGAFYSPGYGNIITQYFTDGIVPQGTLPGAVLGVSSMTRFGYAYNVNNLVSFEFAFADNGADFFNYHSNFLDSGNTQQEYDFDIYNLESAVVLKNAFDGTNSEVHVKFGLAYTYGKETVSFHSTSSTGNPDWLNHATQFEERYKAWGIAPLFGIGFGWSANKYLALTFDYERMFIPFMGKIHYNDPLNSSMQATNMWLAGVAYHF